MYLLSNDQFPKFSHHDACIPPPSGLSSKSGVTSQDPSPPRAIVLKCQTLPPASPCDRGPKLLVFFILTPSPLGPRTWVSRLLSSYATHPLPPGPRRQTPAPLQGHRSHRLLAQDPRIMPCSLVRCDSIFRAPIPACSSRPVPLPGLLTLVGHLPGHLEEHCVLQVEFIFPVLQSWQGGHGQSAV